MGCVEMIISSVKSVHIPGSFAGVCKGLGLCNGHSCPINDVVCPLFPLSHTLFHRTVPWRMVFINILDRLTCPYRFNFHFFTVIHSLGLHSAFYVLRLFYALLRLRHGLHMICRGVLCNIPLPLLGSFFEVLL